jgi:hypothetical protein
MTYVSNSFLTLEQMAVNAQYIHDYLIIRGWTSQAICGMLGNMQSESTINPGIWESLDEGNFFGGFGLVQWTPASKYIDWGYANGLEELNGLPVIDFDNQLDRILYEVVNNIQWIWASMTFEQFTHSTNSPYSLAMLFIKAYERPLNPNQPIRGTQAEYWYSHLTVVKKEVMPLWMMGGLRRR